MTAGLGLFPAREPPSEDQGPLWGYIDREGEFVIAPQFDKAHPFSDGLAAVQRTDHVYGYIDARGEFVPEIEVISGSTPPFTEGVAPALDDHDKVGFVDKQGNWVIPPRFDFAGSFSEGLASVEVDGLYGYIDHSGSFVIPPRFLRAFWFSEGLAARAIAVPGSGQEPGQTKWGYTTRPGSSSSLLSSSTRTSTGTDARRAIFTRAWPISWWKGTCGVHRQSRSNRARPYLDASAFSEGWPRF